jgi:hypothetical protein
LIHISGVKSGSKNTEKMDRWLVKFRPFGFDKKTGDVVSLDISKARKAFP